uniref:p30 n=1 Tax=Olivavirus actinidiae TaxID=2024724 RepID=A0A858X6W1_9CLOS|nr:putative thaumatin-like protein [Actinidia virus 1]QJQ13965.1 p30 [Actinidia virus 1]UIW13917.1 MAG: putative thaumatin-like protein [Actinidia virus 1]UIW13963.1 MAG: putative thaumatin-like protein [Actinidia virus 1]UIW14023.1 MAG: putative thaumatin-like protein [Actinidia virus 1]
MVMGLCHPKIIRIFSSIMVAVLMSSISNRCERTQALCLYGQITGEQHVRSFDDGSCLELNKFKAMRLSLSKNKSDVTKLGNTLVEWTYDNSQYYYDISLVDGYSAPISVYCDSVVVKWPIDPVDYCPTGLSDSICKSPCTSNRSDIDCCIGDYQSHERCPPNDWNNRLSEITIDVYRQAFDDLQALKTCNTTLTVCNDLYQKNGRIPKDSGLRGRFNLTTSNGNLGVPKTMSSVIVYIIYWLILAN